ncbi:right-handed parallel beta-helix repeat-containing protein [Paraglaciecola sp. 25GB23A]|uniref:right-handed parallel beta-helix repeat-containing protein n=1 Tax=Paraglaciecola sp. 25GB23A TaxID=3156068 RepID=UPI0032AEE4FE
MGLPIKYTSFFSTICVSLLCTILSTHVQSNEEPRSLIVNNENQLFTAITLANKTGNTDIILTDGHYSVFNTLVISGDHIGLYSQSKDPQQVIISGNGMRASKKVDNLIRVSGKYFTLDGITLEQAGNHLVQIAGEENADFPVLRNCILRDSYEQLFKVSYNRKTKVASDHGLIENCQFSYSAGIGPQYYIGGIDIHGGKNWTVKHNTFRNIASPSNHVAEHAIHFWNNTEHTLVDQNIIINCDRGIGFGLEGRPTLGGTISNNLIIHSNNQHPYADAGIIIEESPNTLVKNNKILLLHDYPNAIEYRFSNTTNVTISENLTNKAIRRRNGAQATVNNNQRSNLISDFLSDEQIKKWAFDAP